MDGCRAVTETGFACLADTYYKTCYNRIGEEEGKKQLNSSTHVEKRTRRRSRNHHHST